MQVCILRLGLALHLSGHINDGIVVNKAAAALANRQLITLLQVLVELRSQHNVAFRAPAASPIRYGCSAPISLANPLVAHVDLRCQRGDDPGSLALNLLELPLIVVGALTGQSFSRSTCLVSSAKAFVAIWTFPSSGSDSDIKSRMRSSALRIWSSPNWISCWNAQSCWLVFASKI